MRIVGKNSAVTTTEDIISAGGTLSIPTTARIHAIVSASAEDNYDGTLQAETAVIVGTLTGSGDATVTVTSALVTGSPLAVSVALLDEDTAAEAAEKIRDELNATAAITAHYYVTGADENVILTAKVAAANDATLNIAYTNDTCTGLTPDATSNNTTAGVAGTGAKTVRITGIGSGNQSVTEDVNLNGTSSVNTTKSYKFINEMFVLSAGSGGTNAGAITATAATDATVTATIAAGANITNQAFFMGDQFSSIKNVRLSAINSTGGAITQFNLKTKTLTGVWITKHTVEILATSGVEELPGVILELSDNTLFKVDAVPSAGSSSCVVVFDAV